MKKEAIALLVIFIVVAAVTHLIVREPSAKECHTFQRTDTSHIRLNSCTGEAHVVVRGPNGFEWQKIIE